MKHLDIKLLFISLCLIAWAGCGESDDETDEIGDDISFEEVQLDNTIKLFTLPSPLQVATAMKIFEMGYSEDLLNPARQTATNFPTNFLKAVNLGILGIDMGYTTIYEHNQDAIYYLSMIEKLAEELDILHGFESATVKRFEKNLHNQDSLYYIILEAFSLTHKYLQDNDREDVGLLVITGSFIEGLYLITELAKQNKDKQVLNLIGQQKVYLDNLILLLGSFDEQKEVAALVKDLEDLMVAYKDVGVIFSDSGELIKDVSITQEQLSEITKKVNSVRAGLIG